MRNKKCDKHNLMLQVKEKLEMLTHYLRETYFYCIWCAVHYDDDHELRKECPGPTYGDH